MFGPSKTQVLSPIKSVDMVGNKMILKKTIDIDLNVNVNKLYQGPMSKQVKFLKS